MTRRELLLLLMGVTALRFGAGGVSAAEVPGNRAKKRRRFLVVGAGLAGLAAARELQARGHEVVVLEGRERTGGRIWTSRKWPEIPLDLGATWIHGTKGNPITALAREIPANLVRTDYDRYAIFGSDGARLGDEKRLEKIRREVFRVLRQAQDAPSDSPVRRVVEAAFSYASNEDVLLRNFVLGSEIEHEYAGSVDQLSAHWFDNDKSFGGPDMLFPAGFQVITDFLAKGLDVQLGQVVRQIDWEKDSVRVLAGDKQWTGDAVLVTLPLGVLQSGTVRFSPELPGFKLRAISELGSGLLNKCYLRFPEAFWPGDADWLQYVSPLSGAWIEWVSFVRTTNQPVLLGFHAADQAREVETWSDQRTVASAMETLRKIFGSGIPDPVDWQITRWGGDPFAMGSYSYHKVGSSPQSRTNLASPMENRLFFAGEATEEHHFATAHGAFLSGLRAAKQMAG
jgi:monoamine oxidase